MLTIACPALAGAGRVVRKSTSAGLRNTVTGEVYPGKGGLHIYVAIKDSSDAERTLAALDIKCRCAGFGWGLISKNGKILPRGLVDVSVGKPERVCFEGSPILGEGLEQIASEREPVAREGILLDTRATIQDPTPEEVALNAERWAMHQALLADKAAPIAVAYAENRAQAESKRTGRSVAACMADIQRLVERAQLAPDVVLDFDDPELGSVTVRDTLANPAKYAGCRMVDPVFGCDYGYRANQSMYVWPRDAKIVPFIKSMAHGEGIYTLDTDETDWSPKAVRSRRSMLTAIESPPETPSWDTVSNVNDNCVVGEGPHIDTVTESDGEGSGVAVQQVAAPQATGSPVALSPATPLTTAQWMMNRVYSHANLPTLLRQQGSFYRWNGAHYAEATDETISADIYSFMAKAVCAGGKNAPFSPDKKIVAYVLDALKAVTQSPVSGNPAWLNGAVSLPVREFLPCANGLLHLPSRRLMNATPAYFGTYCLNYGYDADAPEPVRWKTFLSQLFPDDPESIDTIQEIFGLALTADTSFQKMFMFMGARRAGKGTIIRVLAALMGEENVAGPTIDSLSTPFGLETLINKQLAVISDARIGPKTDTTSAVERMLAISGEDRLSIPRKHKKAWDGKLPTRMIILSNLMPELADPSGVLSSRFIIINFVVSFIGKEDRTLTSKLMMELPSILKWALDGLDRLYRRGHFKQPETGKSAAEDLAELTSPIEAFVNSRCCVDDPDAQVEKIALFTAWRIWCGERNIRASESATRFGNKIRGVVPTLHSVRPNTESRKECYKGIKLLPAIKNDNPQRRQMIALRCHFHILSCVRQLTKIPNA